MRVEKQQLKDFLLAAKLVTLEQLGKIEKKSQESGQPMEDLLVSENLVKKEDLIKLKAYILGIPFVSLEKEKIDPDVLRLIPEPIARTHNIVAFRREGQVLEVAMLDPDDLLTIDFIRKSGNFKILPRLTDEASLKYVLAQYQKSLEAEFSDLLQQNEKELKTETVSLEKEPEKENLRKKAQELPVVRIVDTLIKHAIFQRASDIHIEPSEKEVLVRYRVDGILREAMILPQQISSAIVARIKVLANLKLDEHRLPQDGRFKVEKDNNRYSIRVSILPVMDGEKIVMRLLPETTKVFSLEDLGFRGKALERIQENLKRPVGMILVTGPTGSGKTTTLYTMIHLLNEPGVNISTIEDPVEYRMPRVNQTQVNPKIGLTFANGLRALVRQDPDIIMVGEIRDKETASLAINAALTGHLVLSTLHTNSAAGAIPRLIDMGIEPFLIASTLNVIVAQRLVRRLCEKEEQKLSSAEIKEISKFAYLKEILRILQSYPPASLKGKIPQKIQEIKFYKPKKSKDCPEGFKGRIGIYEVLPVTEAIKELIIKKAPDSEIQKKAKEEGMLLMIEDGFIKAAEGITMIEEVLRVTME
jgi:type IV pilus assembly protein PilB